MGFTRMTKNRTDLACLNDHQGRLVEVGRARIESVRLRVAARFVLNAKKIGGNVECKKERSHAEADAVGTLESSRAALAMAERLGLADEV